MPDKLKINTKVFLIILDGWGVAPPNKGNAIALANTPFFDSWKKKYAYTELYSYGQYVGLPKDQPGNSEAGHLSLGSGRVIEDDAVYISERIEDGRFFKNLAFNECIKYINTAPKQRFIKGTKPKVNVHLMGLATEENSAHSCPEHWLAMIKFLDDHNIKEVYIHLFTDGRDSSQHGAIKILERFNQHIKHDSMYLKIKVKISSIAGRFYAMDRTKAWERIENVYDMLTLGKSSFYVESAKQAIMQAYNRGETDEFIEPTVIVDKNNKPIATINNGDVIIFMNLRSDRARQLTKAFVQNEFNKRNPGSFKRKKYPKTFFIALTDFGPDLDSIKTAYPSRVIKNTLPIALDGLSQFYIAETEKYAHVTFFFNGGYDHPVSGEKRILIRSSSVGHYDYRYEMRSKKIYNTILKEIKDSSPDFICANFCNADMIGHTGNIKAAIKGISFLDKILVDLVKYANKQKYTVVITSDHGGAEEMINLETNEIETRHTINPVPFVIIPKKGFSRSRLKLKNNGKLADVAPTILNLIGLKKPKEMTGVSLIKK